MVENVKKRKKGYIGEEDISTLLERYSVNTVLTLLQEVSKVSGQKIDWNAIVRNTTTGISSARECQMLWRHLAYGQNLIDDQCDNSTNPMDDDSDLEYEVEALPAPNREASGEAVACVKVLMASEVLMASDCPNDSQLQNNSTIVAPLTINIPSCKTTSTAPSDSSVLANNTKQGTNICIGVSVQKLPLSCEKRPNPPGVTYPPRRKRPGWSAEEDMKLTACVQQHGERNWAKIAREEFDDRKASELSQRWNSLKKKQGNLNVGSRPQNSESQLAAASRAANIAVDMPIGDKWKNARQMTSVGTKFQHQPAPGQNLGMVGPPKPQMPARRPFMNPTTTTTHNGPDSMVKAAAVAAGARIATSADASSLIEATRSQNVVHIITGGNSVIKSSTTGPSIIQNGPTKTPVSAYSANQPSVSRPGAAHPNPVVRAPVEKISQDRS